jgi:hypothetical protein
VPPDGKLDLAQVAAQAKAAPHAVPRLARRQMTTSTARSDRINGKYDGINGNPECIATTLSEVLRPLPFRYMEMVLV